MRCLTGGEPGPCSDGWLKWLFRLVAQYQLGTTVATGKTAGWLLLLEATAGSLLEIWTLFSWLVAQTPI